MRHIHPHAMPGLAIACTIAALAFLLLITGGTAIMHATTAHDANAGGLCCAVALGLLAYAGARIGAMYP